MIRAYTTIGIRIALILGVVVFLGFVVVHGNSVGSTFATGQGTGGLEMKIDSKTWYNGVLQPKLTWVLKNLQPWCDSFFNFNDVKPGDVGINLISIHIDKNPAWVCLDFQNLKDSDNGNNEPESHVDTNGNSKGELSKELEFFSWRDDGDHIFEVGEKPLFGTTSQSAANVLKGKSYALADFKHGQSYAKNSTHYVGIKWCAGDLQVNLATAVISCNGVTMGNEAQTDSMSLDVSFRAVSATEQPKYLCTTDSSSDHHDDGGHDDGHNGGSDGHDDNHHDDDYHQPWHKGEVKGWSSFGNDCKNIAQNVYDKVKSKVSKKK